MANSLPKLRPALLTCFLICLVGSVTIARMPTAPTLASDWLAIQKRGRLIVGVKDNLPPMGFRDPTGNLTGFEIDIARELAKELLGSENLVELVPLQNRDRLSAIWSDRVDLVVAHLTVTRNRSRLIDFTVPYYTDSTAVIVRRGSKSDLFSQKSAIAVIKGSSTIAVLQYLVPQAQLIGVNSYQAGLAALQADKVQAFAGDSSALVQWLKAHPDFERVKGLTSSHSLAIALPRGLQYEDLRAKVLQAVEKWRKNGWLRERASYWGLP
ncbi:transporter substrate-binding domain-containing protein [Pseudanabaena sp. PCC 6802]|uniref:transporter substrate-binding domain-containing protein n=1 Tax=Pseudanabaena sp. PCC 6802 TaxID=118173 RepID=UPI0003726D0D|nr:transporter substrate-binding domain-containing protein [Pseudanabaena sp. PCC 6802]